MAVTVTAVSTAGNWELDGSIVADLPARSTGQLLLCGTFVRAAAATVNLPSASPGAWTLVSADNDTGTNTTAEITAKTAGGSETAPTLSSSVVATFGTGGIILAISGWSGTIADILIGRDTGGNQNLVAPSVANAPDGSLVVRFFFNADNNTIVTPPAGLTQQFTQVIATLGRLALHCYSGIQSGTGASGTATLVASGSDGWLAHTVVIPPATVGPPTNAPAGNALAAGAAAANPGVSPTAGSSATAAAQNASSLIGAAATNATAAAAALTPSLSVRVSAECATAAGTANPAVFTIPSHPSGTRITSTSPRGRIGTSTQPRITTTSPRGWL